MVLTLTWPADADKADFLLVFRELTLEDLLARLKGVADPLLPLKACVWLTGFFLFREEALDGTEPELVVVLLRLELVLVGVGDLDVALEEVGVDRREREELGVSDRSNDSCRYFGFRTAALLVRLLETGVVVSICSSESMRRCVLERRLALVRPVMIEQCAANFASVASTSYVLADQEPVNNVNTITSLA